MLIDLTEDDIHTINFALGEAGRATMADIAKWNAQGARVPSLELYAKQIADVLRKLPDVGR